MKSTSLLMSQFQPWDARLHWALLRSCWGVFVCVYIFVSIEADPCINDQSGTKNLLLNPPIYDLGLCLPCHGTRRLDFIIRLLEISTFYLHVSLTFPWHNVHTPLLCHEKSIMLYVFSIFQSMSIIVVVLTLWKAVKWDERSHWSNQFRPIYPISKLCSMDPSTKYDEFKQHTSSISKFAEAFQVNCSHKHTPLLLRKVAEC